MATRGLNRGGTVCWAAVCTLCGVMLPTAADAQAQAVSPGAAEATLSEIVVTGTRLRARDLTAASPLVTIRARDFQSAGAITIEALLNQLPQVVPSFSEAANNPSAGGAAYIDLRGLGVSRTLVLLNGRRLVGSSPSNAVDVNILPAALIERVEIVTGGASAVYGADAVAGVANFILRDDFEGVEVDASSQISARGDGARHDASLTFGRGFAGDRGQATLTLGYSHRDAIGKGQREATAQAAFPSTFLPSGAYRVGSNLPSQAAVNQVFGSYGVAANAVPRSGGFAGFGFNGDGTLYATGLPANPVNAQNVRRPASEIATRLFPDVFSYNFQPENKLILPLERRSAAGFLRFDASDRLDFFGEAILTGYDASTALASATALGAANPLYPGLGVVDFTIPVSNPFIPADLRTLLNSRTGNSPALAGEGANEEFLYRFRAAALGPRQSDNQTFARHLLAGLNWRLGRDWRLETYVSEGRYDRDEAQDGNVATRRLEQLLDSPTGGTEFCAGGFDPFGVGLNQACGDYVRAVIRHRTEVEQAVASAIATGPLLRLPAGELLVSVGAERRTMDFRFIPDPAATPGEIAGFFGVDPLSGTVSADDIFLEVFAPLLADLPLTRLVDVTLGYRRSEGLQSGGVDSYKIEGRWSVDDAVRFRASYQRAVRSPDVFELFSPPSAGGVSLPDPCSARNLGRAPAVLDLCRIQGAAVGLSPAFIDAFAPPLDFQSTLASGNPNLEPETADTVTAGIIWSPESSSAWLADVRLSLDGWSIEIEDAIDYRDPQLVLDGCYNLSGSTNPTYDPANAFCTQLRRSANDFLIFDLATPLVNQSLLATSGMDVTAAALVPIGDAVGQPLLGDVRLDLLVTWLGRHDRQGSPVEPVIDLAGTIGGTYGSTLPRWRANLNLGWRSGSFEVDLRGRYIAAMEHIQDRLSPVGDAPLATGVGSAWYLDLSARWRLTERVGLRLGVINLLDRDPELFTPAIDAETDPSTYDVIGRRFWAGLNLHW